MPKSPWEANNLRGLRLVRPAHGSGAFALDHLSGGTREQLAAAVRLALAEVLAEAHDGCLPVVFDDAFAYSDPARVQVLQRMLDIAVARAADHCPELQSRGLRSARRKANRDLKAADGLTSALTVRDAAG